MALKQSFTGADATSTTILAPKALPGQIIYASTQPNLISVVNDSTAILRAGDAVAITNFDYPNFIGVKKCFETSDANRFIGFVVRDTSKEPLNVDTQEIHYQPNDRLTIMSGFGSMYIQAIFTSLGGVGVSTGGFLNFETFANVDEYNLRVTNYGTPAAGTYYRLPGILVLDSGYPNSTNLRLTRISFVQCQS